jgi:hypothetical protein
MDTQTDGQTQTDTQRAKLSHKKGKAIPVTGRGGP